MARRIPVCGVVVCAVWLATAGVLAWGETVIPWHAARVYDGDVVTVEGDVARARLEADTCILEFAPDDPTAFRAVLLIPLMTDLPRQPQRLYDGKRVRVTGKIRTWRGRPEMILRGPDAIEVVGVAATTPGSAPATTSTTAVPRAVPAPTTLPPPAPPPAVPTTTPPAVSPPPATAPAPAPATLPPTATPTTAPPATLPPTTVPPAPAAPSTVEPEEDEAPRLPRRVDPCDAARERWRRAAGALDARAAELTRCLRAGAFRCRPAAGAMAPALSELEWAEQQVEAACP